MTIGKHLARRSPQALGNCCAAEHPSNFFDASGIVEPAHGGLRPTALDTLFNEKMCVGERRNLREVRDA